MQIRKYPLIQRIYESLYETFSKVYLHPSAPRICCRGLQIKSSRDRLGCRKFIGEHFRNPICGRVKQAGLSRKRSWMAFSHNKSLSRPHEGNFKLGWPSRVVPSKAKRQDLCIPSCSSSGSGWPASKGSFWEGFPQQLGEKVPQSWRRGSRESVHLTRSELPLWFGVFLCVNEIND